MSTGRPRLSPLQSGKQTAWSEEHKNKAAKLAAMLRSEDIATACVFGLMPEEAEKWRKVIKFASMSE
jgi:hypothetical protein